MFVSVEFGIEILRLKGCVGRSPLVGQRRLTCLIAALRMIQEVLYFADVSEIRAIASAAQNLDGNLLGRVRRCKILLLKFQFECSQQLRICVIVEMERVFNVEASR